MKPPSAVDDDEDDDSSSLCPQCSRWWIFGACVGFLTLLMAFPTSLSHLSSSWHTLWGTTHGTSVACISTTWTQAQSNNCSCPAGTAGPFGGPCTSCMPATYSSGSPQASCLPCSAGKYQTDHAKSSCDICPAGHYCVAGARYPRLCEDLLYSAPGSASRAACQCGDNYYRSDEQWSHQCMQSCPIYPPPRYGRVQQTNMTIGATATLTCNDGYHMASSASLASSSVSIICNATTRDGIRWPPVQQPLCIPDRITVQPRILVLYAYHGSDTDWTNLEFFIQVGVLQYVNHTDITFIIIVQHAVPKLRLPPATNIIIVAISSSDDAATTMPTRNGCTYERVLADARVHVTSYDYVLFIPSSSRGPFLPRYVADYWIDHLLAMITKKDNVKLLTTTLICNDTTSSSNSHHHGVRMSSEYIYMIDMDIWPIVSKYIACCGATTNDRDMTSAIINNGYNIATLSALWRDFDLIQERSSIASRCNNIMSYTANTRLGDVTFHNGMAGTNVLPFELMFIPTNHAIDAVRLDVETPWTISSIETQRRIVPLSSSAPSVTISINNDHHRGSDCK